MTVTRPRSLLFLSCDIVGSTAYKQRPDTNWHRTFLSFYREFPQELANQVKAAKSNLQFELWKPIGDELLFFCEVGREEDVFDGVRIWLAAMDAYEAGTLDDENLGTKGGAFIATVPGPDSECSIPRDPASEVSDKDVELLNHEALDDRDHERFLFDFFGPSIDTGFRVTTASSARYFTLSIEVAWAMQRCHLSSKDDPQRLHHHKFDDIAFLETRSLKGVWSGRDYPLFVIDRLVDDPVNRALHELQPDGCNPDVVGRVCAACMDSDAWPSALYLPSSSFAPFRTTPRDRELPANEMVGAETAPDESPEVEGEDLPDAPPLG